MEVGDVKIEGIGWTEKLGGMTSLAHAGNGSCQLRLARGKALVRDRSEVLESSS